MLLEERRAAFTFDNESALLPGPAHVTILACGAGLVLALARLALLLLLSAGGACLLLLLLPLLLLLVAAPLRLLRPALRRRLCDVAVSALARVALFSLGVSWIRVVGPMPPPAAAPPAHGLANGGGGSGSGRGRTLAVSNHVNGLVDGLLMVYLFGSSCSLVVNECGLWNLFPFSRVLHSLGCVFVNPFTPTGASDRIAAALMGSGNTAETTAAERNDDGFLVVFPEGGATNGTCVLRFRTGAFRALSESHDHSLGDSSVKNSIHTVSIQYPRSRFFNTSLSARGEVFSRFSWAMKYLLISLCEPFHSATVRFHPSIPHSAWCTMDQDTTKPSTRDVASHIAQVAQQHLCLHSGLRPSTWKYSDFA
ncbi:hypothetical protein Pelo_14371 [Pelomyxa schiedti]|nr:hypothetical protein Pelo_14371 [Pelomyxa schiedti]